MLDTEDFFHRLKDGAKKKGFNSARRNANFEKWLSSAVDKQVAAPVLPAQPEPTPVQ